MYITNSLKEENAKELGMEVRDVEKLIKCANHVTTFNKKMKKAVTKPADTTEKGDLDNEFEDQELDV